MTRRTQRRPSEPDPLPSVESLMARMADGDTAALFDLHTHYGRRIMGAVRAHAAALHCRLDGDERDGLVLDVCLAIFHRAKAWRPDGGANPWVWAERLVISLVAKHVRHDPRALARETLASASIRDDASDGLALLDAIVGRNALCSLLQEALQRAGRERNVAIFLDYEMQRTSGDLSPADTLAAIHGLTAPTVRQVVHRTRKRLRTIVHDDPRFADLRSIPLLESSRP